MAPGRVPDETLLARGLLALLAAGEVGLPESGFLTACRRSGSSRALRTGLDRLVASGAVVRRIAGRGARLIASGEGRDALLTLAARGLGDRARIPGRWVKVLLGAAATRQVGSPPRGPEAEVPREAAPSAQEPSRVLSALRRLGGDRRLVEIHALATDLGLAGPAALAGELRRLRAQGRVRLEPLADPQLLGRDRRGEGIEDPVKGLLYFVALVEAGGIGP